MNNAVPHFIDELNTLLNRFREEYEMTYAEAIGCLFLKCHDLADEAQTKADEPDEETQPEDDNIAPD